jgi:hypothetical protein
MKIRLWQMKKTICAKRFFMPEKRIPACHTDAGIEQ